MSCSNIPLTDKEKYEKLQRIAEILGLGEAKKQLEAINSRLHENESINEILTKATKVKQLEYELSVMERVSEMDKSKLDAVASDNTEMVAAIQGQINKLIKERSAIYSKSLPYDDKIKVVTDIEIEMNKLHGEKEEAKEYAKISMKIAKEELDYNKKREELEALRKEVADTKVQANRLLENIGKNFNSPGTLLLNDRLKASGDVAAVLSIVDIKDLHTEENGINTLLDLYKQKITDSIEIPSKKDGENKNVYDLPKGKLHGTLLIENPGLALLLDVDKESGAVSLNDNVVMALAVSAMTTLQDTGYSEQRELEDVIKEYGLNPPTNKKDKEYEEKLAKFMTEVEKLSTGKPLKVAAYEVGKATMSMLGLTFGKDTDLAVESRMIASLGSIGLQMATSMGIVQDYVKGVENSEQVRARISEYLDSKDKESETIIVRINPNMTRDNAKRLSDRVRLFDRLFGNEVKIRHTWSTKSLPEIKGRAEIHNGTGLNVATQEQTDTLNKVRKQAYKENGSMDVLLEIFKDAEGIMKAAGWYSEDEIKEMKETHSKDYMDQVIGTSRAVERKVNALMEFKDVDKAYFDWFVTVAGRYGLDSTTVNPQTDKEFARWMVVGESQRQEVEVNDKNDMEPIYWTIAQGFGIDVDSMKVEDAVKEGMALVAMEDSKLIEKITEKKELKDGTKHDRLIKLHPGQAASALMAIRAIKAAREAGKDTVELALLAEVDGKTNGFAIRLMQFPFSRYEEYLPKVGVVKDGKLGDVTITEPGQLFSKSDKLMDDVYEGTGAVAIKKINEVELSGVEKDMKEKLETNKALPKLFDEDKDGNRTYDMKLIRKLAKNPTMTFNYSAGAESMTLNLINEIATEHVEEFMAWADSDTKEALKKESVRHSTNKQVVEYRALIRKLYAEPIVAAIQEEFNEYVEFNAVVNAGYRLMYEIANKTIEEKLESKPVVTKEEYQQLLKELADVLPGVATIESKDVTDKLIIANRGMKDLNTDIKIKVKADKRKGTNIAGTVSTRGLMKWMASPGNSGSVLTIHNTEGSIISGGMRDGATGINDALAAAAGKVSSYGNQFNEDFFNRNMEFSMLQALWEQMAKVSSYADKKYEGQVQPTQKVSWVGSDGDLVSVNMNMAELLGKLTNIKMQMDKRRNDMLGENWSVMQMNGLGSAIYETKRNNSIISAKKEAIGKELKALIDAIPNQKVREKALKIAKDCI